MEERPEVLNLIYVRLAPEWVLSFAGSVKPRPHQQQCRSNTVECYESDDSFDKVECCFDIAACVDGA